AVEVWGLKATLKRCVGMFALALWDREERVLILARDRLGEKPLYYGRTGDAFLFGSELKALQAHPAFEAEVDRNCLALYLRYCHVPEPYSIFHGILRLPAGTVLKVSDQGRYGEPVRYWSAAEVVKAGRSRQFDGGDQAAIQAL